METLVFLIGVVILMLWIARDRIGVGRTQRERDEIESNRPVGYGATVAPPGTARGASVQAPFFGSDRSGQTRKSDGAE